MENQSWLRISLEIQQAASCGVMVCYIPFSPICKTNTPTVYSHVPLMEMTSKDPHVKVFSKICKKVLVIIPKSTWRTLNFKLDLAQIYTYIWKVWNFCGVFSVKVQDIPKFFYRAFMRLNSKHTITKNRNYHFFFIFGSNYIITLYSFRSITGNHRAIWPEYISMNKEYLINDQGRSYM